MVMDPRKRQQKMERRKKKAQARRRAIVECDPHDIAVRIERSTNSPILHCCATEVLWEQGMSSLLVSRQLASGNVAFVAFLLDVYCLGVKDVMYNVASRSRYDREIYAKLIGRLEVVPLEPAAARKLIEGAVDFAKGIGFLPHRDYAKGMRIFGDIDAASSEERFRYGKDGKPFFISGPHDSPSRCDQIIQRLSDRCGPDGFHYTVRVPLEPWTEEADRLS